MKALNTTTGLRQRQTLRETDKGGGLALVQGTEWELRNWSHVQVSSKDCSQPAQLPFSLHKSGFKEALGTQITALREEKLITLTWNKKMHLPNGVTSMHVEQRISESKEEHHLSENTGDRMIDRCISQLSLYLKDWDFFENPDRYTHHF